ncbi:nucleoid-associated protein YgaU, partial [Paraburkholderia sp. MM5384-R2]|nr:nucleoid-associated protein YgaU [Paraburkholderia sp. MM5384-R2]
MRKLMMSLLMAGSLLAGGVGTALADDASAPAAASAPDTTASAPAPDASAAAAAPAASAPAADASAAAAAAPATPTAPFSVDSSKINSGDTAWMLTSTALVLFMTIP